MGSATARCLTLLAASSPFPLLQLQPRPSSLLLLRRLTTRHSPLFLSHPISFAPFKSSQHLHSQTEAHLHPHPHPHSQPQPLSNGFSNSSRAYLHLWPEWSDFVSWVSISGYCNRPIDTRELVVGVEELPLDFLRAANGCLAFAGEHPNLLWSLPREDIKVIIDNGSPFLFKDASSAVRRMQSFLGSGTNDVLQSDKPSTVDLMKYLLSYARMAVPAENMHIPGGVQLCIRKLFVELAKSKGTSAESDSLVPSQFPVKVGQNIEMKRGDWICSRCNFMNFARNSKCLQCEECRPKRYLTGGEWDCPQCDFYNFGRNVVCLRCDCKKPGVDPSPRVTSVSGQGANTDKTLVETGEKQQQWLTKITQLEKSSDSSGTLADEDFSETMGGIKRFPRSPRNSGIDGNLDGAERSINAEISQSLDKMLGQKSPTPYMSDKRGDFREQKSNGKPTSQIGDEEREEAEKSETRFKKVAELHDVKDDLPRAAAISNEDFPETMPMRKGENRFVISKKKDRSLTSPMYKRRVAIEQATTTDSKFVPFVPFPPNYFADNKPKEATKAGERKEDRATNQVSEASNNGDESSKSSDSEFGGSCAASNQGIRREPWRGGRSLEGSAVKEPDPLDMSEEAKAERWFKRVAQIKDISELSQIPDEDFPSIMPMRKGVNRFVVSKRKTPLERRLASSQYRRNPPVVNKETDSS